MARVALICGKLPDAEERAAKLRRAGHDVMLVVLRGGAGLSGVSRQPPAAFVIDLDRAPAQGRDVGLWLRGRKATRHVPIVFVGGIPQDVGRAQRLLPDAVYATWPGIRAKLRHALEHPPAAPVAPAALAGYSGTPLPKKLGIKAGTTVALLGAPKDFEKTLGALPKDVALRRQARGRNEIVLLFITTRAALDRRLPAAERALAEGGALWLVWPKQSSGVRSDLTQAGVRSVGLAFGLVDYKIAAIDEVWSGLRFARRK